jgi:MFS family permease
MTSAAAPLVRDVKIMGLIGMAHASSHYYHLVLPPLFPILKEEFEVSYTALGALPSLFFAASGIMQIVAGFLVDRFGARRILLLGLTLLSLSVAGFGLVSEFWMLFPLAVLAGIGNSVFHPADLAILTAKVSPPRLGRGYAIHALAGNVGWAAAPIGVISITQWADWRTALIVSGLIGLGIVASLMLSGDDLSDDRAPIERKQRSTSRTNSLGNSLQLILNRTIVSCLLYFAFLAMALIGVQTFGVPGLMQLYGIPLANATAGLAAFLIGSAIGVISGGFAADWTDRHDLIATAGMALAAVAFVCVGGNIVTPDLLLGLFFAAGFVAGMTSPSRDMMVRKVTPKGASGRIFGFVYSGLDIGSALMPLLLGLMLDHAAPDLMFYTIALMFIITALTIRFVKAQADQHGPSIGEMK